MTDWYVRPSGGSYGSENGTSYANAWDGFDNITWGSGGVVAGDTLFVCGTHYETLIIEQSGTSGNKITITGEYATDPGIIDGSVEIDTGDWAVYSGDVYRAAIRTPNIDYINDNYNPPGSPSQGERWWTTGDRCCMPKIRGVAAWEFCTDFFLHPTMVLNEGTTQNPVRYPKTGFLDFDSYDNTTQTYFIDFTDTLLNKADDYWVGGQYVWPVSYYLSYAGEITDSTGTTITCTKADLNNYYDGAGSGLRNDEIYIQNVIGEISAEDEWAHKDGYLYYHTPGSKTIRYFSLPFGVFCHGYDYIKVTDLTVKNTNYHGITFLYCDNIDITDNTLEDISSGQNQLSLTDRSAAIHYRGDHYLVTGNTVDGCHNAASGIVGGSCRVESDEIGMNVAFASLTYLTCTDLVMKQNTVENIGTTHVGDYFSPSVGIAVLFFGVDVVISRNTVDEVVYFGIGGSYDALVEYNLILNTMRKYNDGGAIYSGYCVSSVFRGNVIENVWGKDDSYRAVGIYLDVSPETCIVEDNTFYKIWNNAGSSTIEAMYANIFPYGYTNTSRNNDVYEDDTITLANGFTVTSNNNQYAESTYVRPSNVGAGSSDITTLTTGVPTTLLTTLAPTTLLTTSPPTTLSTTIAPTTIAPTTIAPTTSPPTTIDPGISAGGRASIIHCILKNAKVGS